jgi:hypothetical protein
MSGLEAWTCAGCGRRFAVPSLARDHEDAHEREVRHADEGA